MITCIVCGCTDDNACTRSQGTEEPLVCQWIHEEGEPPLCSFCQYDDTLYEEPDADVLVDPGSELILPGDPEFHL